MYAAKVGGRNRVCRASEGPPEGASFGPPSRQAMAATLDAVVVAIAS